MPDHRMAGTITVMGRVGYACASVIRDMAGERGSARRQMQKSTAWKFHGVPSQNTANAGAGGSGDTSQRRFSDRIRARRRHQAAIFRKRRPRYVAVFGQLSVKGYLSDRLSTYHFWGVTPM
jgi:hypothetical protein